MVFVLAIISPVLPLFLWVYFMAVAAVVVVLGLLALLVSRSLEKLDPYIGPPPSLGSRFRFRPFPGIHLLPLV
jgi:hypothetical protein